MPKKIGCQLQGLPKEVKTDEVLAYLSSLIRMPESVVIVELRRHRKTCTAIVSLPNKNVYKKLTTSLRETPFQGNNFLHAGKATIPTNTQDAADDIDVLTKAFHKHLCQNPELLQKASDRDGTHQVFQAFYNGASNKNKNCTQSQRVRVEALVMTRLRQKKLVRSKRFGDKVVMVYADKNGTFPSAEQQDDTKNQVLRAKQEQQENKQGVVITDIESCSAEVGETKQISLDIQSDEKNVILQKIVLAGPQRKDFKLAPMKPPDNLPSMLSLAVTPNRIGVFRTTVVCHFVKEQKHFSISRFINVRSGNKEMDRILRPKTPFQRRIARAYQHPPKESFDPPQAPHSGYNPFKKLSHHSIPTDVKDMIMNKEFEHTLQLPDRADGYATFWKNMLWSSEFQNFQDIQLFDMNGVKLSREGHLFSLTVPGLAEGRPSVLRGDLVHVTWNHRLYKGRVERTKLLDVLLEFHPVFHKTYNPSLDAVDARFTFSRMTYRTSHEGCIKAEATMKDIMLAPQDADVELLRDVDGSRESVSVWKWANRGLNQEQKTAVQNIVHGKMRPLPYIIFGPPGTGTSVLRHSFGGPHSVDFWD